MLCCTSTKVASDNIALYCKRAKMSVVRVTPLSERSYTGLEEIEPIVLCNIVKKKVALGMYVDTKILTQEENDLIQGYITAEDLREFKRECQAYYERKMEENHGVFFIRNDINARMFALMNDGHGIERGTDVSVYGRVKSLYTSLEMHELNSHKIVVSTCAVSGDERLKERKFDAVIIDEASLITEPEQMIAMVHTDKHVVVVGDRN